MVTRTIKYFISISLVCALALSAFAGRIEDAFKALSVFDYFKAKELFEKSLKNNGAIASYGLSILYSRDKNPFHDLDSAYKYIAQSEKDYILLKTRDKEDLTKHLVFTQKNITDQKQNVANLLFDQAVESNDLERFEAFVGQHSYSVKYNQALAMRDSLAFSLSKKAGSWEAYKDFVDKYPQSQQADQARSLYEQFLYNEKTQGGTIDDFAAFLKEYPQSRHAADAQQNIYRLSTLGGTVEEYYAFIKKYPNNLFTAQAWDALYLLYFKDFSAQEIAEFNRKFPDSPYKDRLEKDSRSRSIEYYPIMQDKLYGFVAADGRVIVRPEYDFVDDFSEGFALVGRGDSVGYVNTEGKLFIGLNFTDGSPFSSGLAVVSRDNGHGVINKIGKIVVPLEYDKIQVSSNGIILAEKDSTYNYISSDGNSVMNYPFTYAEPFHGQMAIVKIKGSLQVIDTKANVLLPKVFTALRWAGENILFAQFADKLWYLTDMNGAKLSKKGYNSIGEFKNGLAWAISGDEYGYIDPSGREVIAAKLPVFTDMSEADFKGNRAKTYYRSKYGMINKAGDKLLPSIFDDVYICEAFPVPANKAGLWGYVNKSMGLAIKYQYNLAFPFEADLAVAVDKKGMWGVINVANNAVIPFQYSNIERIGKRYFIATKDGKTGIIAYNGAMVLPMEYDRIRWVKGDVVQLIRDEKFMYYDLSRGTFLYRGN